MANEPKIDYEDIFNGIKWDLDKAKYLLTDLHEYFECPDLDYPPRENIENIRTEFKRITVIVGLLNDLADKIDNTISPML